LFTLCYAQHTCALASHIALIDAGAPHELKRINFRAMEQQSPGYVAINPKARVPSLITPRGILTETPAILAFIAQSYPEARLASLHDSFAFAEMQAFNSYLCATVHVAHAHRMRGTRWADEEASFADMRRKVPQSTTACYELIEQGMLKGPWVMGEAYTVADPYLFTIAQWLEDDGVDSSGIPRVMEHRSRMLDLPNVKQALAEEFAA